MRRFAAAALLLASTAPALAQSAQPLVEVPGGTVGGYATEGALVFRGIPFAAPPLGELRWKPPAPVVPWPGVRDAVEARPSCLQHNEGWNRRDWLRASEDCLTLDVRTTSLSGKRPVMVWIHGGSNVAGSAEGPALSRLSDRGVVVVSIQYRLGVLGFLSHRALAAEQGGTSGNYALMDQIAGLEWVRDNIARFGGDPAQVTIFGESAGSQDVSLMLAAPAAQKLSRAAIMESGTPGFGMSFRTLEEAFALGDQLDALADSGGDIARLRALSPFALITLQDKLDDPKAEGGKAPWLRITVDGKVLPEDPRALLAKAAPKPVIIGTNTVEFGADKGSVALEPFIAQWFEPRAAEALAAYRAEEVKGANPRAAHLEMRIQSDGEFICPANRLAEFLAGKGWPVWRYEFDMGENGGLTRHAYEIGFVLDRKPVGGGVQMQDYWAALAIAGDPNARLADAAKRPRWEQTSAARPRTLKFGEAATVLENTAPRAAFCKFTDRL